MQNVSPTLNKSYAKIIVKLFLHLKWYLSIMPIFVYLELKFFSLHDFTLIASVVGESVICHGIGGNYIPA